MPLDRDETFDALGRAYLTATRALGKRAVVGERPGLRYGAVGTRIPGFNRLMLTRMDPLAVDRHLDEVLTELAAFPVLSAWVPEGVVPSDVVQRLVARGFQPDDDEERVPAMTRPLADLPPIDPPAGVTIDVAASHADVVHTNVVMMTAFGGPPSMGEVVADIVADSLLAPGSSGRLVMVSENGKLVSTALGWVADEVMVVYNVGTLPEVRGRGFGSLATMAAMHLGRELGARDAVLESSAAGYPVYRRLGFEDVGRFTALLRRREDAELSGPPS